MLLAVLAAIATYSPTQASDWARRAASGAGRRGPASERPERGGGPPRLKMLRIGFDLDGVVADFRTAFLEAAARILGREAIQRPSSPMPDFDAVSASRRQARMESDHRDAELVARARAV